MSETATRFDGANKPSAGTALLASPGALKEEKPTEAVPVVKDGIQNCAVNRLGAARVLAGYTAPVAEGAGSTTTTAKVTLGNSALVPFLVMGFFEISTATQLLMTSMGNLPAVGQLSVGSNVVAYTSSEIVTASGFALVKGLTVTGSGQVGGNGVGQVIPVASTTGFSSTGGVGKIGSAYFVYRGFNATANCLTGVSGITGEFESGSAVVGVPALKLNGTPANYPTSHASVLVADAAHTPYQAKCGPVIHDELEHTFGLTTSVCWVCDMERSGTGTISTLSRVVGGTRLKEGVTLPVATIPVYSTVGFPSSGYILVGGKQVKYGKKSAEAFEECIEGSGAIEADKPVTPAIGKSVAADSWVRPRFAEGTEGADDKGLVTVASGGPYDSKGHVIGHAAAADDGAVVKVFHTL